MPAQLSRGCIGPSRCFIMRATHFLHLNLVAVIFPQIKPPMGMYNLPAPI